MRALWFYILCWKHRNDTRYEMFEQYTLVLKAARRCAYDLRHAASGVKDEGESKIYHDRAYMWQEIFSPTGGKDYRHRMHGEIRQLESEISRLLKVLKDNGIEETKHIPF